MILPSRALVTLINCVISVCARELQASNLYGQEERSAMKEENWICFEYEKHMLLLFGIIIIEPIVEFLFDVKTIEHRFYTIGKV